MSDPFQDPLFRERTRKLLAVVASDQPGEAEAARRKLLAHLETHGAAWSDLVDRVDVPSAAAGDRSALVRRAERAEAALRDAAAAAAAAAEARVARAEGRARAALLALGCGSIAGAALAAVLLLGPTPPVPPASVPGRAAEHVPAPASASTLPSDLPRTRPASGAADGQVGYVRAAGAPLRPVLAGAARARPLPGGAPVVVVGRAQFEGAEWFRVRSEQGEGFLPAEAVDFTAPLPGPLPGPAPAPGPPADGVPAR